MSRPRHLLVLLASALTLAAQEPAAEPAAASRESSPREPAPGPAGALYSLSARRQDAEATILAFARRAGVNVVFLDRPATLISIVFKDLPFDHGFRDLLAAAEMTFRKLDGDYVVGSTLDMRLRFPDGETTLDAIYRCRRISPLSLVNSLKPLFPSDLAMAIGPLFLTPALDGQGGGGMSGDTGGKGNLKGTDDTFKTHDVVFSGPTALVQRALTLARKFDRPRRMVRIIVKVVEMSTSQQMNLGVDWMDSLALVTAEQPVGTSNPNVPGASARTLIDGIRVGRFSHSPLVVSATLNALETRGYVNTMANPTLMLLDGERSYIQAGSLYTYPVFTMTSPSGQPTYSIKENKIGIYLQVGVQIGVDNDLTISLFPQVTFALGRNVVNGAEYPIVGTREVQTTVRATSGEMIVLGGLLQNDNTESKTGMPFLSRIPLLGRLFGSANKVGNKTELMVFVTPELIEDPVPATQVEITVKAPT